MSSLQNRVDILLDLLERQCGNIPLLSEGWRLLISNDAKLNIWNLTHLNSNSFLVFKLYHYISYIILQQV